MLALQHARAVGFVLEAVHPGAEVETCAGAGALVIVLVHRRLDASPPARNEAIAPQNGAAVRLPDAFEQHVVDEFILLADPLVLIDLAGRIRGPAA